MELIKRYSNEYADYLKDESRHTGRADYIAFPGSKKEVRAILTSCLADKIPVTIQGSRTGITGGSVSEGGLILNLERMNKVLGVYEDESGFWILRCEPGLKLSELREILKTKELDVSGWAETDRQNWYKLCRSGRYFFPPDPTETSASLGGMVSCNASGARGYKYGATRNWIKKLEVMTLGERVGLNPEYLGKGPELGIKNAAGYYLREDNREFDHFIGAEGSLGVIVEIEIRLLALPSKCWSAMQFFFCEEAAVSFSDSLKALPVKAAAIEYFDSSSLELLGSKRQLWADLPELRSEWKAAIYYEYEGEREAEVEEAMYAGSDLAEEYGSSEEDCWLGDSVRLVELLKTFRHALPEGINLELDRLKQADSRISKLSTDLVVPHKHLGEMLKLYKEAQRKGWQVFVFGHIGNDHLHTNILPRNYEEYQAGRILVKEWAKRAVEYGGSVSGEHGIGKVKRDLLVLMYDNATLRRFRDLKRDYDKNWLLNRGNLLSP